MPGGVYIKDPSTLPRTYFGSSCCRARFSHLLGGKSPRRSRRPRTSYDKWVVPPLTARGIKAYWFPRQPKRRTGAPFLYPGTQHEAATPYPFRQLSRLSPKRARKINECCFCFPFSSAYNRPASGGNSGSSPGSSRPMGFPRVKISISAILRTFSPALEKVAAAHRSWFMSSPEKEIFFLNDATPTKAVSLLLRTRAAMEQGCPGN